jgi:hypothetical protein
VTRSRLTTVAAALLLAVVVAVELGALGLVRGAAVSADAAEAQLRATIAAEQPDLDEQEQDAQFERLQPELERLAADERPGVAIPSLALLDAQLLLTVALLTVALLVPDRLHGRLQGAVTLVGSIFVILAVVLVALATIALLALMVGLLSTPPFGTLAYVARFGFFDRGTAALVLTLLLTLKLAACGALVVAHPRVVENKGLVALAGTSLVLTIVVSFLHGLVPRVFVSLLDAVGAIVVAIVALVWAVVLLAGAVVSVVKVLRVDRALAR